MKHDLEDELYEKDIDEMVGFHIVGEDEEEEEKDEVGIVTEEDDAEIDDELPVEEDEEVVGEFGGKDFDFEHEEDES